MTASVYGHITTKTKSLLCEETDYMTLSYVNVSPLPITTRYRVNSMTEAKKVRNDKGSKNGKHCKYVCPYHVHDIRKNFLQVTRTGGQHNGHLYTPYISIISIHKCIEMRHRAAGCAALLINDHSLHIRYTQLSVRNLPFV